MLLLLLLLLTLILLMTLNILSCHLSCCNLTHLLQFHNFYCCFLHLFSLSKPDKLRYSLIPFVSLYLRGLLLSNLNMPLAAVPVRLGFLDSDAFTVRSYKKIIACQSQDIYWISFQQVWGTPWTKSVCEHTESALHKETHCVSMFLLFELKQQ